jgi:putative transposase
MTTIAPSLRTPTNALMPRRPRLVIPDMPMHVIQRGNNRTPTFPRPDDFERYWETLLDASRRFGCAVHAYVFMPNHVHLLITPHDVAGPSRMMQTIGRRYVRWVNSRYDRTGTLWEGRFKSSRINSDGYFFNCSRYIELNPVRAEMVDGPGRYRWSSHNGNAFGHHDPLITRHSLYESLGTTAIERQANYQALFRQAMEPSVVEQIRRAGRRGRPLGTPESSKSKAGSESGVGVLTLTPDSDPGL